MARAYESDGRTFFASDDRVNALASAWYGFGWFHFGITDGLLKSTIPDGCPFSSPCEPLPSQFRDRLNEKSGRYKNLLDTARHAVRPAPEAGSAAGEFADRVLFIVSVYAGSGNRCHATGAHEDALARFSYAHGWLDAGVTAGLFVITDHHELFTV
ncbi:MAG: DUF357 domain-containing protein [Methanoregulaceae archaeon]|nr:MAG: DUF357 domain-containing protein [Methanoregulaceae archaeon]